MDTFTLSLPLLCMICFFVFLAGFVDAAAGGGGLISLPAYIASGMPVHMAYGGNKFSSACGTTLASVRFFKNRSMDVKVALLAAAGSFIGSGIAAHIVLMLDDQILKRIVIIFLPVAAAVIFLNRGYGTENHSDGLSKRQKIVFSLLNYFAVLNIGLGVFNLIPIPPLDGSKVYGILVHDDENYMEKHVNRYGYFVLAILAVTGILSIPMSLAQNAVIRFMYGIVRSILRF